MQNLEGEIDSAHVQQLHAHAVGNLFSSGRLSPPRYQIEESSVGLLAMAVRQGAEPGETYWRVTPYLMPSFTIIPAEVGATQTFTAAVPIDDVTMAGFTVTWNPIGPLTDEDRRVAKQDDVLHVRVDPQTFLPLVNKGTNYSINRAAQASGDMTGIPGLRTQDLAVQEDQCGPISQREREHLGSTDRAIVLTRRLLLETARALAAGVEPTQPQAAAGYLCHSVAVTTHSEVPWQEVVGAVQPSGGALICPSTPSREAG